MERRIAVEPIHKSKMPRQSHLSSLVQRLKFILVRNPLLTKPTSIIKKRQEMTNQNKISGFEASMEGKLGAGGLEPPIIVLKTNVLPLNYASLKSH